MFITRYYIILQSYYFQIILHIVFIILYYFMSYHVIPYIYIYYFIILYSIICILHVSYTETGMPTSLPGSKSKAFGSAQAPAWVLPQASVGACVAPFLVGFQVLA